MIKTDNIQHLKEHLKDLAPYPLHSRVHKLKTFITPNGACFVKREDELGFGISGSKMRKYASLIPYLLESKTEEAIIIGSAYSNNVVGLCQLLIENNIKPVPFLLGEGPCKLVGNFLLTSLFVHNKDIHWIKRDEWHRVNELAKGYIENHKERRIALIPEGACMPEALPGMLSLPVDILRNEEENSESFKHIFMDAGTGLTAIATILAFAWLDKNTCVHVLLLACEEEEFVLRLKEFKSYFEALLSVQLPLEKVQETFKIHRPRQAKSFGSMNKTVLEEISRIANNEGFLTDPVYSAKLFLEIRHILQEERIQGNTLIIHSGGGLTLMGFQEQLQEELLRS